MLIKNSRFHFVTSRQMVTRSMHAILVIALLLSLFASAVVGVRPAYAAATLTVEPITWDIIGLDSNKVTTGPNHFPVGVRVCNTGPDTATNVRASFVWDSSNSNINLRPGTAGSGTAGAPADLPASGTINLAINQCTDFYFEVEVTRTPAAYDTTRAYHINITADSGATTASSPTPRQLYVERLVSQFRNYISDIQLSTDNSTWTSYAPNSTMTLVVGQTYYIKMIGLTATQGYEQIETFINFPNTIFQVLSVDTTYSAESSTTMAPPYDKLYGNACVWVPNPLSPNYRTCVNQSEKAGGNITVTYQVQILQVPGAPLVNPEPLNSLIYDFSGSSYHYNADYSVAPRYAQIVDPGSITIRKNFSPDPIGVGGISALTFTITNPNAGAVSDVNFRDYFPTTPGAMTLANTTTTNTCGGTLTDSSDGALNVGDVGIRLVGGTVPANGSCSITVNVTASSVGTHNNTYDATNNPNHLFIGTTDTGNYPQDTLTVTTAPIPPAPPSVCAVPVEMARWEMPTTGQGSGGPPPPYTSKAADVATASASYVTVSGAQSIEAIGSPAANSWGGTAPSTDPGPPVKSVGWFETPTSMNNYFQFQIDTSNYGGVYMLFNIGLFANGDWANPTSNVYVNTQADAGAFTVYTTSPGTYPQAGKGVWTNGLIAKAASTGTSTTTFRIGADGSSKPEAKIHLDNVVFYGCQKPTPPTVTKAFSPNPVAVGNNSTLTITINNPNAVGQTLNGIAISDFLPSDELQGTIAVTNGSATVTGTGTAFKTQLVPGSVVTIPSTPVNLTGTISVTQGSTAVTGSGTAFTTELAVGSVILINSVEYTVASIANNTSLTLARAYRAASGSGLTASTYRNYTVLSIASDTSLTLASNYGGATTSGLKMSAGLTLAGAPTTTCGSPVVGVTGYRAISLTGGNLTGTLAFTNGSTAVTGTGTAFNTQLGVGSVLSVPYQLTGTVAVTNGSTVVTGTGTTFTTQLAVGQNISINGVDYIVNGIASNTSLSLTTAYAGATASGLTARGYQEYTVASVGSATSLTLSTNYSSAANLSGLTIKAGVAGGSSCTITASVKASLAGTRTNVTGMVTAPASGDNTTSTGYATANLSAVLPPVISKVFSAGTIPSGGTSVLTFTITNPNPNNGISGVAFTDTYPAGVTNTNPASTTGTTCNGTLTAANGGGSVSLTGASLAAGASCLVKVAVTSSTVTGDLTGTVAVTTGSATVTGTGTAFTTQLAVDRKIYINGTGYRIAAIANDTSLTLTTPYAGPTASGLTVPSGHFNISGNVSHVVNGNTITGNTASDTLAVRAAVPGISLSKQVGNSSTGPWYDSTIIPASSTTIYYRFIAENIGDVDFTSLGLTDSILNPIAPNTITCTWRRVSDDAITTTLPAVTSPTTDPMAYCIAGPYNGVAGRRVNTATITGTTASAAIATDTDSAAYQNGNFGHLPYSSYDYMNLYNEGGAFHVTNASTRLGAQVPVENDGSNSDTYVPDTTYDDGVTWTPGVLWKQGTVAGGNGGSINTTVACPATCYLHGWIDWNGDGDFDDPGEHIVVNQTVTSGSTTLTFDIPGTAGTNLSGTFYARFRLYSTDPGVSATPNGQSVVGTGEVEDYKFVANNGVITPVTVSYFRAQRQGGNVNFEWSTSTETGNAGFNLYVEDAGQLKKINDQLIPSQVFDSLTAQEYSYNAEVKGNTFFIEDVSLAGETRKHGPFQQGQSYGDQLDAEKVNWTEVQSQKGNAQNERQKEMKSDLALSPSTLAKLKKGDVSGASQQLAMTSLNFKVRQTGIYRVTYETLKNAGLDLAGVPNSRITLLNRGVTVPVYVEGNGKFGPGGFVEFYGEALDTLYTDMNIYTLQVSNSPAAQINGNNAAVGAGLQTVPFYAETLKVNKQRTYASSAPGGDDPWYDTSMMTFTSPTSWNFPFQVDGLANSSSPASLELVVWGMTDWSQSADHHLQVAVNNVRVADEIFGGSAVRTLNINVPSGTLKDGENTLQLTLAGDTGVAYDITYLDKFSVTYQRTFKAQNGRLTFTSAGKAFQVTDLPSKDVVVYRISEDGSIVRLNQVNVRKTGNTFTATFAGTNQVQKYVVTATETISAPEIEITRLKADLNRPAQFLIIAHPDFIDGIQPLVQARRAQGMTVSVVDVMDLYARYTHGIFDPQAIKEYISFASQNLGTQYVLLVGGDTYDYRNHLGVNSLSFIPSLYADTGQYTRFAPVDPLYADVNGDNVPDLAIGRFPARTTTELALIVDKTLSYAGKDYTQTAVFLSDYADGAVSFKDINTNLTAKLPSNWSVENIHLDNSSFPVAKQNLIAAMNRGTAMVTFTGHSDLYRWNFGNLFTYKDAAMLTNNDRPFVAVQWGCYNTYYVDPVNNSLVQSFLFSGDQGAAALLGAATRTNSESEHALGIFLTPRLSKSGEPVGRALLDAKHELAKTNPQLVDVLLGWTLIGDPTLVVEP